MKKIIGVYRFLNIGNSKVYVGSSRNIYERKRSHINELKRNDHHSFLLQRSWNKHGEDTFIFEILEIVSDISKLKEREQYWINFYDAANPDKGYNRSPTAGSNTGIIITEETRERLRTSHLGHIPSKKANEAARKAMLGKKKSKEAIEKSALARTKPLETRICACGCGESFQVKSWDEKQTLNREHSDKARHKLREIRICLCGCNTTFEVIITSSKRYILRHINKIRKYTLDNPHPMQSKKHTKEALERMSTSHKDSKHSEETKKLMSDKRKKFILENGLILPREIRICACGCNKIFEIRKTLPNKYLPGHLQILRGFKKVTRICICGCNQMFNCFSNSAQESIFGHNAQTRSTSQDLVKEKI